MSDTEDDMRAALDKALAACIDFTMIDTDGHVELVDGYVDTGELTTSVLENLIEMEWEFNVKE